VIEPSSAAESAVAPHPLIARLLDAHGFAQVRAESFASFAARPGHTLLFFTEDPVRYRETLDLAVIAPELARAFEGRFALGVLLPEDARAVHPHYGFRRWPAFVLLRDGQYVGAIDGVRNWDDYLIELARLLEIEPSDPPAACLPLAGDATCH
jgi:hydrogenase-1 operon protein HyaE